MGSPPVGSHSPNPADPLVLAQAFARRGFGTCAVSPPRTSTNNAGIVESTILAGRAELGAATVADNVTMPVLGSAFRRWALNRRGLLARAAPLGEAYDVTPNQPALPFAALLGFLPAPSRGASTSSPRPATTPAASPAPTTRARASSA